MTTNPYAPPTAEVADVIPDEELDTPVYFAVSPTKLFVMSVVTLSFYVVYWFYKNWTMIKQREGRDILPVLRAVFSIFFAYSLFKNIHDEAERYGVRPLPTAGLLAVLWILCTLASNLPGLLALLPLISGLFLLPVQACANRINAQIAPNHNPNARFTAWNWVGIVIGVLLVALAIFGSVLPDE